MKIVDVDISEMDSSARRGRSRSPEMEALVSAVASLKTGDAKAIVVTASSPAKKIRSRLLYAARIAEKRLQIGEKEDRVIFALDGRPRQRRKRKS